MENDNTITVNGLEFNLDHVIIEQGYREIIFYVVINAFTKTRIEICRMNRKDWDLASIVIRGQHAIESIDSRGHHYAHLIRSNLYHDKELGWHGLVI